MSFIILALQLTPAVIAAGGDIARFVDWAIGVWNNPDGPQPDDWKALRNLEAHLAELK